MLCLYNTHLSVVVDKGHLEVDRCISGAKLERYFRSWLACYDEYILRRTDDEQKR